ncbi:hypothetical protein SMC26_00640 [Actinomadura fulvescens]|uniref:Uncharacterized protein n=1 Tax=Actinomadura fulvescens TaxID=46160 RepID=A0ABN3PQE4_9ACTN
MRIEDRLRDALRATADTIDDDRYRPLPERPRRPSLRARLAPVLAPLAVVILLVGFLAARQWSEPDEPERPQHPPAAMPKFFAALKEGTGDTRSRLHVRESGTGRVLDTFRAPWGITLQAVTTTAGGQTFLATSRPVSGKPCASSIHRVRVNGEGKIIQNEFLNAGNIRGGTNESGSIAVTPDGRHLAYAAGTCDGGDNTELGIIDLETGRQRVWKETGDASLGNLSWSRDGERLFFVRHLAESGEARMMDVSNAQEGTVGDRSEPLWRSDRDQSVRGVVPDATGGKVVVATFQGASRDGKQRQGSEVLEIAVDTRRVVGRVLSRRDLPHRFDIFQPDVTGRYILTSEGIIDLHFPTVVRESGKTHGVDADWG